MKTIPQIRIELLDIADTLRNPKTANKIRRLVKQMIRRSPIRKAKTDSQPMTKDLAYRIRKVALANPKVPYMQMARIFDVSVGRISEAIAGKRTA